jgi:hypothetical protein
MHPARKEIVIPPIKTFSLKVLLGHSSVSLNHNINNLYGQTKLRIADGNPADYFSGGKVDRFQKMPFMC